MRIGCMVNLSGVDLYHQQHKNKRIMTPLKAIAYKKVADAIGLDFNSILATSNRVESEFLAKPENASRIEIVEKPEDDVVGVFVDNVLVMFLCDNEDCEIEAGLVEYLRS